MQHRCMLPIMLALILCACGSNTNASTAPTQQGWEGAYNAYAQALIAGDTTTVLKHVVHVNGMTDEQLYPIAKRYSDTVKAEIAQVAQSQFKRVKIEQDGKFVTVYDRVTGVQTQASHCVKTQMSQQDDGTWLVMDWNAQADCPAAS